MKMEALYPAPPSPAAIVPPRDRDHFYGAPQPHADIDTERLYRKQRLAAGFRIFARFGFHVGLAGHITARDPEWTDHFWAHPWGMPFRHVKVSDLVLVDPHGDVVMEPGGPKTLSGAAFPFHFGIYQARPDVVSVAHTHSFNSTTWSTFGRLLTPITQNSAAFYEGHAVFDEYNGIPFEQDGDKFAYDMEEGTRIAQALGSNKALFLKNHGPVTVGSSVELCVWRFVALDYAAKIQLAAESNLCGGPQPMPADVARKTAKVVGADGSQWLAFNSLWQEIVGEQPDLLE